MRINSRSSAQILGLLLWCASGLAGLWAARAEADVNLTEFMASNGKTLMDRDREFSDWIELHNSGTEPVNLGGWYLTDKPDRRNRWQFPDTTLAPGGYLVVFASGKDRRVAGQELHTNFKLNADGGYLALVRPDGRTIASEFSPGYPPQSPDVSYGFSVTDPSRVLTPSNSAKRVLVPTKEIDPRWTNPDFDDASWLVGTGGVGFDSANEFTGALGTNVRGPMLGRNASVLARVPFDLADTQFDRLKLRLRYDDGFVAYLNGVEVARRNAPTELRWNSSAAVERKAAPTVLLAENFESAEGAYTLLQTTPKMRPRVNATQDGASGKFLRLVNGQADGQVNSVTFNRVLNPGAEPVVTDFDFRFKNAGDAPARLSFLLVPAAASEANSAGVSLDNYAGRRHADFPGVFSVEFRPGHSRRTACAHWGQSSREDAGPVSSRVELPGRQFHHAQIQLKPEPNGARVTVHLSPGGGRNQTVIQETFVPGLKLSACRVQIAAQLGTWDNTVDLANVRLQTSEGGGLKTEEFDLAGQISALRPGRNVLAIHGLNRAPDDPAFLILPELVGRARAGPTNAPGYFAQPTPRAANKQSFARVAPLPIFSRRGGVLTNETSLELKAKSGVIRYTRDGTEPTASSPEYSAPLRLNESGIVRARAFEEGAAPSAVATEAYTLLDASVLNRNSNLPLVIVNSYGRYIRKGSRTLAYMTVLDGGNGRTTLRSAVDFHGAGEMNMRGFSSLRQPKRSYTFRARDDAGGKLKASILGLPKHSDWVLFAPFPDKTLMRDVLAYELSRKMGEYAPRTRFVEVFMANRGGRLTDRDYLGVYVLIEKIERGKERVNIQELTPSDNTEPNITGGYIFKRDHSDDDSPDFSTSRGSGMFLVEPSSRDATREQRAWISRYMGEVERAIYGPNFRDPQTGYAKYLDVDAFINQHWLIEMSKNIDGFRYSVFFTKDRGGKLKVQPVWDWNLSFGNANYHDGWDPTDWYSDRLRSSEICWFRRLNQDPEFAQRAIDRWAELRRDVFATGNILRRVDEMAAQLNEAQVRNFQKWQIMGREVWPNHFVGDSYKEEVDWMKKWIQERIAWIDRQLPPTPVIAAGEPRDKARDAITLRCAKGKIYYTLDGTDPRQPGGGISPSAQVYKSAIPMNGASNLFARALDNNTWSAPVTRGRPKSANPPD